MPLYRPSELREFLATLGVDAKKSLSQNFLIDGNIVNKICELAEVSHEDRLFEIGPGPGALTEALLAISPHVIAVEKDRVFAEALKRFSNLQVVAGDVLEFDMTKLHADTKVVANIPYHITTPIIEAMIASKRIKSATLMVQKELADRMVAKAGTRNFSSLGLFVQINAKVRYGFDVPAGCFYPRPNVDSAVIRLDFEKQYPIQESDEKRFEEMARAAFQQRRKTLVASLKSLYTSAKVVDALQKISKQSTARPEELSLEEWVQLFHHVHSD